MHSNVNVSLFFSFTIAGGDPLNTGKMMTHRVWPRKDLNVI
jgi:hypothetical protein